MGLDRASNVTCNNFSVSRSHDRGAYDSGFSLPDSKLVLTVKAIEQRLETSRISHVNNSFLPCIHDLMESLPYKGRVLSENSRLRQRLKEMRLLYSVIYG